MTERARNILLSAGLPLLFGLLTLAVTWGVTQSRVSAVEQALPKKADNAVVNLQYQNIIERLDRLSNQMERHIEARP